MFLLNNAQISWSSTLWWFSTPCCYGSLSYGSHCYSFQWFAMIYLWFIHQKVVVRWFSTSKTASVVSISANCDPSPFDSGRTWGNILDFVFPELEWAGPWGHTDHVILLVGVSFLGQTHMETLDFKCSFCIYSCYFDIWSHVLTATNETMTWSWCLFFFILLLPRNSTRRIRCRILAGSMSAGMVFTTVQP